MTLLLQTGNALLVEASPYDRVWGIGTTSLNPKDFRGENLLGKALMQIRDLFNSQTPE